MIGGWRNLLDSHVEAVAFACPSLRKLSIHTSAISVSLHSLCVVVTTITPQDVCIMNAATKGWLSALKSLDMSRCGISDQALAALSTPEVPLPWCFVMCCDVCVL